MEELQYKEHIEQTRKGNVGSSDARMIQQIAELGKVPHSAIKRMALIKGFTEVENVTNVAMRFGDYVENMVFESLHASDERWQSNPCLVSKKYSRKNCGVIDHVDFLLQDDENKTLTLAECKATRLNFEQTKGEYLYQLCHHWLLGKELAKNLGDYKLKLMLCHYDATDIDLDQPFEFDPSRLTVKTLQKMDTVATKYNINEGMDIIDKFLENFDEFYEEDEVDSQHLPEKVRNEFDTITTFLAEIKERQTKVEDFKERLCAFMQERGIKSVKNDAWSITFVNASESVSIDYKKVFEKEIEAKKPRVAKRLREVYKKVTKKKPYVAIKLRDNKENNN